MKRRAVLASLGATLGGLAGCAALPGGDTGRTLTPAPVPTNTSTPRAEEAAGERTGCPELPAAASRYICSPERRDGLALRPTTDAGVEGSAGRAFTLTNRAEQVFETGRDRWLLARRADDGWVRLDTGGTSADLALATGGSFTWVVNWTGNDASAGDGAGGADGWRARVDTQFADGAHAFIVTGYTGDELVSVMATFWVPRLSFRTASGSRQQG